jgi:hypothetical protein
MRDGRRGKVTRILSDLLRFAQTKNTFWWEKAGKDGKSWEGLGSGVEYRSDGGLSPPPRLSILPSWPSCLSSWPENKLKSVANQGIEDDDDDDDDEMIRA